ncbi:MAG: hypothetical protein HOW73_16455 [Polyangiaceae bacterium]|nr:hypothetical protein [Polyangiaceae bacterium]
MDPGKAGIVIAIRNEERVNEITKALEGLGLIVNGCRSSDELRAFLTTSLTRADFPLPEVVVLDAELLSDGPDIVALLKRARCLDDIIVILPESWPRGVTPDQLQQAQVLQSPFLLSVLVEEVARRMTPASVRACGVAPQ